jgi:2-keto-3-deoxy-6-phosphogluconate aldolase
MARLTAAQRKALPKSAFAVPSKAPGPGSYPMNDAAHVNAAKSMGAKFASPAVKAKIAAKAKKKGMPVGGKKKAPKSKGKK